MGDIKKAGHVVDMSSKRSSDSFRICNQIEAYWESLRLGDRLPCRADVDPRGIEDALNNAFILEAIGAGHGRFRIAGMHLNELMGMDVRGMPASCFLVPQSRDMFAQALTTVLQRPAVVRLSLRGESRLGQPLFDGHMLMLPLVDDEGKISRVLGCLETFGTIGRSPRRFELKRVDTRRLDAIRSDADLPAAKTEAAKPTATAFAEADAPFTPRQRPSTKPRPHYLRLIKPDE